jgi:hypothetical protein
LGLNVIAEHRRNQIVVRALNGELFTTQTPIKINDEIGASSGAS